MSLFDTHSAARIYRQRKYARGFTKPRKNQLRGKKLLRSSFLKANTRWTLVVDKYSAQHNYITLVGWTHNAKSSNFCWGLYNKWLISLPLAARPGFENAPALPKESYQDIWLILQPTRFSLDKYWEQIGRQGHDRYWVGGKEEGRKGHSWRNLICCHVSRLSLPSRRCHCLMKKVPWDEVVSL